jgi:hypothetical protein
MKLRTWLMIGMVGFSNIALAGNDLKRVEREVDRFERKTGVELHISQDDESTKKTTKNPVKLGYAKKAVPIIMEVLMQYPEIIRGGLLTDVHLYGKLRRRDKGFLGQARPKAHSMDLAIRRGTRSPGLQRTVHHEVSHLIEMHPKFPADKWKSISDDGYGQHQGESARGSSYLDDGFVSRYGSKNRHEDFAELAELAFMNPERARKLASKYPEIGVKLKIMTRVYSKVAPEMLLPWVDETDV